MSRKPIIINDVDVSGCEDYKCDGTCASSAYHLFDYNTKYLRCINRNCQYKQLKHKDLEIGKYKDLSLHNGKVCNERLDKIDELEHKVNEMEKGYAELTEIVTPYIDDFTGYNEELGGFDIVLCVKELMQQFSELKEKLEKERALKQTYLTCYKTKHGDVKGKLFKYETYKQALQEIEDIAKNYFYNDWEGLAIILEQILEKCEVLKDE